MFGLNKLFFCQIMSKLFRTQQKHKLVESEIFRAKNANKNLVKGMHPSSSFSFCPPIAYWFLTAAGLWDPLNVVLAGVCDRGRHAGRVVGILEDIPGVTRVRWK